VTRLIGGITLALLVLFGAGVAFTLTRRHNAPQSAPTVALYRGSQPPPGLHMPAFVLDSYRGRVVRSSGLRGKVVLVTFLDTACKEKCPIIAGEIGAGIPLLTPTERGMVDALAITVLPQVDTPKRVRRFLRRRRALGKLDWLIGPVAELPRVWKAFSILAAAQTGNADTHSADVRVFDRNGTWVSTLHAGVDLTPANLAHDIRVALRKPLTPRRGYQ
jgi:cytochrome oxidase Cu insertion factor (SCO1/SenC/PrrC family)